MTLQELAHFVRDMRAAQVEVEQHRYGTIDHARASGAAEAHEQIVDRQVKAILGEPTPNAWDAPPLSPCVLVATDN